MGQSVGAGWRLAPRDGFDVALLLVEQRVPANDVTVAIVDGRKRRLVKVLARHAPGLFEGDGNESLGRLARTLVPGEGEDDLLARRDRAERAMRMALAERGVGHVHAPLSAGR